MIGHRLAQFCIDVIARCVPQVQTAVGMALDATGKPLPVLTVWGWRDSMCPAVPGLARVRALVPQTEVWLDPNAGHAMPLERPADVAERLVEFWSRV